MQQYCIKLDLRLTAQNTYQRATKLLAVYKEQKEHALRMENQAEILDNYITMCMLTAEATIHCHNFKDFSPKKVELANMEKFWKLALQADKDNRAAPTTPMAKIITNYPNMETSRMHDRPVILEQLCSCKENYRQAIAKGKELQHKFLLERAETAASNNNQTLETAIKQLAHIEVSIQTYTSIKCIMKPATYQPGLTSIQVPTDDGLYRTVIDPKEIEDHLINRNLEHYAQAEHTAMAHHLIRKKMGTSGQQTSATRSSRAQQIYQIYQPHFNQYFSNYTICTR
jgi:hypothetical protein